MNWLEGLIYGLISGFCELLPVSSQAHQLILVRIFGVGHTDHVANLVVHISSLLAILLGSRLLLHRLRREQKAIQRGRRTGHGADSKSAYDLRMIRGAIIPMLLGMLLLIMTRSWNEISLAIACFSIINGIILFVASRFPQANKDARHMSLFDAIMFGIFGVLSVFPGISRVGASMSYASMRGADKQQAINWCQILSIPAILVLIVFDIVGITGGMALSNGLGSAASYIMAAIGSFIGTYLCVFFIRTVISRANAAGFAYYSWGIALLIFVLYLIS